MQVDADGVISKLGRMIPEFGEGCDDVPLSIASGNVVSLMQDLESCIDGREIGELVSFTVPKLSVFAPNEREIILSRLSRDEYMGLIRLSISKAMIESGVDLLPDGIQIFDVSVNWEEMRLQFGGLAVEEARRAAWSNGPCKSAWEEWASSNDIDFESLELSLGLERNSKKLMGKTNGDRVRLQVKKGDRPIYGWGMMKNGDVGVVKAVDPDKSDVTVDFDSQSGWTGTGKELVLTSSPVFIFPEISVGDLVRLNPEEEGPVEGDFSWPESLGHQIGEVHSIDHDDGTIGVKFPLMDQPFCISSRYATKTTRKEAQEILARRVAEAEESVTDFGEEE